MRVETEHLVPGVENSQHTDASSEQAWVAGHLAKSLGGGPEQQLVEDARIRQSHRIQLADDGKGDVAVGDGQ